MKWLLAFLRGRKGAKWAKKGHFFYTNLNKPTQTYTTLIPTLPSISFNYQGFVGFSTIFSQRISF